MRTLKQLSTDIGKWADANFGDKRDGFRGMVEELGEFANADFDADDEGQEHANRVDALCDVLVYALDYAYCEKIVIWDFKDYSFSGYGGEAGDILSMLSIDISQLARSELKHKQGIKGYDVLSYYTAQRENFFNTILVDTMECLADLPGVDSARVALNDTFDHIVSKRNWKLDPKNGGGHTHIVDSSYSHITIVEE